MKSCLLLVALLALFGVGHGKDMFTALVELTKALQAEHAVAHDLRVYIKKEQDRIQILQSIANDLEEHSSEALGDPMRHLANPVNAYLIVKRFAIDWANIVDRYIKTDSSQEFLQNLGPKTCTFPDKDDLYGSAVALLRLQDVYALPTNEISTGNIRGVVKSPDMSADDCFHLGLVAYNREDYYHAVMWMGEALALDAKEPIKSTDRKRVLDYLSFAMYKQGNVHHAYNLTVEWLKLEPGHLRAVSNLEHYGTMIREQNPTPELKNERVRLDYRGSEDYENYEKLCRGEKTHKYRDERLLTCQFRRHLPMFYINPLREEVVYLDPRIVIYHNILTAAETDKVMEIGTPMLERSGVFQLTPNDNPYTEYRTSKTAWLSDSTHPLIAKIAQKARSMSNLTLDTVEFLQVLNYGIGGQYEPHYDFARPNELGTFEDWRGNRVATVIFYMTDVEAGGATVFNELGVRLTPEKGACAIWYNLLRNGDGDYRTRHAGCPVLSGTKWVCNKWFHINGQEFSRPCTLNPNE